MRRKSRVLAVGLALLMFSILLAACGGDSLSRKGGSVTVSGTTEYTFRPNSSGLWTIETTNETYGCDPYLWLYGPQGLIESNDDGGSGYNARIRVYLDKGTTYTIRAGYYSNNENGVYLMNVGKS